MDLGGVEIDPVEYASQGSAVLGIRDSGKSYTATKIAEQLYDAGIPFVAFDPIGVWRYLRVPGQGKGYPVVVAGGQEGDLPLSPATAPMIVEAAMQNGVSLVIDLFDIGLSKADWRAIVRDCVRLLLHRNKEHGLRHVFLEEAAEFAPQKVLDGLVYAEIEKLARMGGNSRLGYTLVNQRSQELNKAVLELCDNLFLHRQRGKNALEGLKKWLEVAGAAGSDVIATLPTLPQGECWAWLSSSDTPVHVKVPQKQSLHPDRRLLHGEATSAAKKAVRVEKFVSALEKTLPRLEEEAKANDPKALRTEIAQLQRKLAAAERSNAPPWPDLREEVGQLKARLPEAFEDGRQQGIVDGLEIARDALANIGAPPMLRERPTKPKFVHNAGSAAPSKRVNIDDERLPSTGGLVADVPAGCGKPLAALAAAYPGGMTEAQWATVAGYKRTGGTWKEYRSRLRRADMIEQRDGLWHATELGAQSAGDVELPPPPGPDLARWWRPRINVPERVVEALILSFPSRMPREELAAQLDMAASGGSFKEYLSRLRRNEIATENKEGIRLSDAVMVG